MKAEQVGLSTARLARLDEVMKTRYVDGGHLPGLITQVFRRGELVHSGLSGHMDLERDKPMREDAIFRIYSMTKPITAVALMMLAEEGLVGLDDDVASHIPAFKRLGVYASGVPTLLAGAPASFITTRPERPMKVVDLVTHTSGLTYGFMMRTMVDFNYRKAKIGDFQTPGGLDTMIDQLAAIPLEFSPGTAWNYSTQHRCDGLSGPASVGDELRRVSAHPALASSLWACTTPASTAHRRSSTASPPATSLAMAVAASSCRTTARPAPTPSRRPWNPAAGAWSPPPTTTCASAG